MEQTTAFVGGSNNPSTWSRRFPGLMFSLLGFTIAMYLAFFQFGFFSNVWEPFFGNGSRFILKESAFARFFPIPDASLGAAVYFLDAVLECLGGQDRWRTAPWTVLALGLVAAMLAVTGLGLALSQPLVFHHYCTLCLAVSCCSILTAVFAFDEVRAALSHVRQLRTRGASWLQALRGVV